MTVRSQVRKRDGTAWWVSSKLTHETQASYEKLPPQAPSPQRHLGSTRSLAHAPTRSRASKDLIFGAFAVAAEVVPTSYAQCNIYSP
jgi:hypothetical protein